MTCPVCGTVAVPGARFCHTCGAGLPAAAALPAKERRVVTVLFGDLSDFTAWAEDLDPERVGAVTDRVLAAFAGAVTTFGGHVDKLTGDGIMAVFGAPVAHEDDSERAMRAALAMQQAVRRVLDAEQGGGVPLGLRVGLNTGPVVAGLQASLEYTVVGDTVNTAARLGDSAAIGTVYAGAGTVAATKHVAAWRRLPALRLKGKREPVEAYELLGLRDAPGTRSGLGDEAPFVGREPDLGRFASRLAEVVDRGQPRVLVLTAEAGVGKTRFAAEAGRYAGEHGARVLSVHCAAFGDHRRLAPLADLVRGAAGFPLGEDGMPAVSRENAQARLLRLAGQVRRDGEPEDESWPAEEPDAATSPEVPDQTGAEQGGAAVETDAAAPRLAVDLLLALLGYGELPPPRPAPATPARDGVYTDAVPVAVAELLSVLATESPLAVMVDDVHDATPETVDAFGAMIARLSGPVLVLLLGRPELAHTAGVLTRVPDAEVSPLPPLRGADAARLLRAHLGGERLSSADEDRLLSTAQGNPFYLAELVTLLIERQLLTGGNGRDWRLARDSLDGRLLSRDLAAVLAARIDVLPPEARAVLRDAAVIGGRVPAGALEALLPPGVEVPDLHLAVEELLARRMLRRTARGGYAFTTPLMRQAAYAGIGRADLALRHARLAAWAADQAERRVPGGLPGLVDASDPAEPTEEADRFVAEHAERAVLLADTVGLGLDAEAREVSPIGVAALIRLARTALDAGEPAQAARMVHRASTLSTDPLPPADQLLHARALLQLGRGTDAADRAEKVAAGAEGDDVRAAALVVAGQAYRHLGEPERGAAAWSEALAAAERADLPSVRAEVLCRLGMADYVSGRLAEAEQRFDAAYQVSVAAGDRSSQAWALQHLAWVTTTRGDFDRAEDALGHATELFTELEDGVGRAWARGSTAFVRLLAGRLHEARRLAHAFLPFGERIGETWAVGTLRSVAAYADAELGNLTTAEQAAQRAFRDFDATDDDWGRGLALVVRALVVRARGDLPGAIELLTDAERHGEKAGHPLLVGAAQTMRGFCQLDRGDPVAAEADSRRTLELVEPFNVLDSARVGPLALLGEARRAQGDSEAALRLLGEVAATPADQPSVLFPRRQVLALYAEALLADGQVEQAVEWSRRALAAPAEDVRSRVLAYRALAASCAAAGDPVAAREAATSAVELAGATEQAIERAPSEALLARLS